MNPKFTGNLHNGPFSFDCLQGYAGFEIRLVTSSHDLSFATPPSRYAGHYTPYCRVQFLRSIIEARIA